jgi:hypothetical protein
VSEKSGEAHFNHFIERCKPVNQEGVRNIGIGDGDEYLDIQYKIELIQAFTVLTKGVLEVVNQWSDIRDHHGSMDVLFKRFPRRI